MKRRWSSTEAIHTVFGIAYINIAAVAVLSFMVPLLVIFEDMFAVIFRGSAKRSSRAEAVSFNTLPAGPEAAAPHSIVDP
jgi:hypothetical protein